MALNELLKATARWSLRWFNKPKFHILLHLPTHICRFGPAPFFATEGFELMNAVIRLQSVLSNCSAPSKDITSRFSYIHAVCHLVCGSWYRDSGGFYQQAGENVRQLFQNMHFRAFIRASKLCLPGIITMMMARTAVADIISMRTYRVKCAADGTLGSVELNQVKLLRHRAQISQSSTSAPQVSIGCTD